MSKRSRNNIYTKISKYLPVLIILLSITIIVGSTFAYFTDKKDETSSLTFSKVELSSETTTGINGELRDVIPGTRLVDGAVEFSKSIDSEAIYVRAKISFSLPREFASDIKMQELVKSLRSATDFNIRTDEQHGAVWSEKKGNYFYLLNNADTTKLMKVDTIDTYVLSNEIVVPRDLESLEGNYQYMKGVNFHLAFEAIQADNVSDNLSETKEVFNTLFPESDNETEHYQIEIYDKNLETILTTINIEDGKMNYVYPISDNEVFEGWYLDKELTNKVVDFNINQNIKLYPKILEKTSLNDFTFNNNILVAYNGEKTNVVVPESYSLGEVETVDKIFNTYRETMYYARSNYPIVFPITATDNDGTEYEIANEMDFEMFAMYVGYQYPAPVTIHLNLQTYVEGNDFNVEIIGAYAFFKDIGMQGTVSQVTEVYLPDSIIEIRNYGFGLCKELTKINLPNRLIKINENAFTQCELLENIILPESLESIGASAFNQTSLVSLFIPSRVKEINNTAFLRCSKLQVIEVDEKNQFFADFNSNCIVDLNSFELKLGCNTSFIPKQAKSIGRSAFQYYEFSEIIIPDNIETIGIGSFEYCTNLTRIDIPDSVTTIEYGAFEYSGLQHVKLPSQLKAIEQFTFYQCISLVEIDIPETVEKIDDYAFAYCTSLTEFIIPNSVKTLGSHFIGYCSNIKSVTIPSGVIDMQSRAFYGCSTLANCYIYMSSSISKANDWNSSWFCSSNTNMTVHVLSSLRSSVTTAFGTQWNYYNYSKILTTLYDL